MSNIGKFVIPKYVFHGTMGRLDFGKNPVDMGTAPVYWRGLYTTTDESFALPFAYDTGDVYKLKIRDGAKIIPYHSPFTDRSGKSYKNLMKYFNETSEMLNRRYANPPRAENYIRDREGVQGWHINSNADPAKLADPTFYIFNDMDALDLHSITPYQRVYNRRAGIK